MFRLNCTGTPYEIGLKHGREAHAHVARSIIFYKRVFKQTANLDWDKVRDLAMTFKPVIRLKWPAYLDEMQGVADGAQVTVQAIIALNVRTEIAFGLFTDGCTALSWKTEASSFLAQNWDWQSAQQENLILLTIAQPGKPVIKMITEAGIIGKIGLNDCGVGVCLNAIRAKGMDVNRLPVHLGLRMVLESRSRDEAVRALQKYGIAAACHMLIADASGGVGLEWSVRDVRELKMDERGRVLHTNHYVVQHAGVRDSAWLADSGTRIVRLGELCDGLGEQPTKQAVTGIFRDEQGWPMAICRAEMETSLSATLFSIVMDLGERVATVTLGRPVEPLEVIELGFTS